MSKFSDRFARDSANTFCSFLYVYIGETKVQFWSPYEGTSEQSARSSRRAKIYEAYQETVTVSAENQSAITDHINTENHVMNCDEATIIDRESDKTTRWIREVVKI